MSEKLNLQSKDYQEIQKNIDRNLKLTQELNTGAHSIDQIRDTVSQIVGEN